MAGITIEIAEQQLQLWIEADAAVSKKQSKTIAGRTLTFADAATITAKIEFWKREVRNLQNGGIIRHATVNL